MHVHCFSMAAYNAGEATCEANSDGAPLRSETPIPVPCNGRILGRAGALTTPICQGNPTCFHGEPRHVPSTTDDSCFVLESAKNSQPKPAAAVRVVADCPAEFDGPAWNSCVEGRMYFYQARDECWCLPLVGTVRDRIELVPCSSPNVVAPSPKN